MTTRYLSGAYPGGYTLNSIYAGLVIESTASVGGTGVVATSNVVIQNLGLVQASGDSYGIFLHAGGSVTNGSANDTAALIAGAGGIRGIARPVTIANFGTILSYNYRRAGVALYQGGTVTNGSSNDRTAVIAGWEGVSLQNVAASVHNYGTIDGDANSTGVLLEAGGTVINGSAVDTSALITEKSPSSSAIIGRKVAATVVNFGTVDGIGLLYGGTVVNGSASDTAALIAGDSGVWGATTVANFGTIAGVRAQTITNGSALDTTSLINGAVDGSGVTNFGTITSVQFAGVDVGLGSLVNGSATDTGVLISGAYGVIAGSATVTNFGTIIGTGGQAVKFDDARCVLAVEAGCDFVGRVSGGAGTLDLASGMGIVSGLLDNHLTVSGSMPRTSFSDFGVLEIAAGAGFVLAGPGTIASGGVQTLIDNGLFTVNIALTISGTIAGSGMLAMRAGTSLEIDNGAPSTLTTTFAGGHATLALMRPSAFTATVGGMAATDTIDLLGQLATTARVNAKNQLVIGDNGAVVATLQLKGNYETATFKLSPDGKGGTDVTMLTANEGLPFAAASVWQHPHVMITAMANLGATAASAPMRAPHFDSLTPTTLAARAVFA